MKLQDALKRIIMEFGISALKEKRLVFLLSDYKAFDDYPAVKPIMKTIAEDGYGNELCSLLMDGSREKFMNYAGWLKKTLSADRNFKPELVGFAVDCILSVMGLVSSVNEPSDHGFDPFRNSSGTGRGEEDKWRDPDSDGHEESHANQESAEDLYNLGWSFAHGDAGRKDYVMAVRYWRKAAAMGHAGAECSLGNAFARGEGVEQDHAEAVKYWRMAALKGHSGAQRCLGYAYAHGQGVAQDNDLALKWYRKAVAQGDSLARKELDDLLRDMQRAHERQFADNKSGGIHSAGTGSQAGRQSLGGDRDSGSHAPSRDSSGSPVISGRIGRMEFWHRQKSAWWRVLVASIPPVLCYVSSKFIPVAIFFGVIILFYEPFFKMIVETWRKRAKDLGYNGRSAGAAALLAYLSLPLFVCLPFMVFLPNAQFNGDVRLPFMALRVCLLFLGVAGACLWTVYGLVKGEDGANEYGADPTKRVR